MADIKVSRNAIFIQKCMAVKLSPVVTPTRKLGVGVL